MWKYAIIFGVFAIGCTGSPEIVIQSLTMETPESSNTFREDLLPGEIADTKIEHVAYAGPVSKTHTLSKNHVNMFLFIRGSGRLKADSSSYQLVPESIAIPIISDSVVFHVSEGETLHFIQFTKTLSPKDIEDMKTFPDENKYDLFFTRFIDCEPYTEKIKSPNTVSRTVLPQDIIPRISLGTVEAPGPDEVGAHEHPMLDQLFLGLTDNDVTVYADDKSVGFGEFDLLHIPIGSRHWVTVDNGKKMYYMWMDFFLTREGQEWLKTHKPVTSDDKDY